VLSEELNNHVIAHCYGFRTEGHSRETKSICPHQKENMGQSHTSVVQRF